MRQETIKTFQILTLLLAVSCAGSAPMADDEPKIPTLSVTGNATVEVPTETTEVRLACVAEGKTAEQAHEAAAKAAASVVKLLKKHDVEKLETTGLRLDPQYRWDNKKRTITGYVGRNSVSFRVPTERSGEVIDAVVGAGATEVDGLRFIADDEALEQGRKQALEQASRDARSQADAVLAALGLRATGVIKVHIGGTSMPSPRPMMMAARTAEADMAKSPIEGGDQEVRATVTLEIAFASDD